MDKGTVEFIREIIRLLVAGAAGGFVGGIIAPLVNWGIEKRRETREYKRSTIKRWREYIDRIEGWNIDNAFQDTSVYSEMKQYLRQEVREKIERPRNTLTQQPRPGIAINGTSTKQLLLDDIARIEKEKWRLV